MTLGTAGGQPGAGLDDVNRPVWSWVADEFVVADSWTDPGEREAVAAVADRVRGAPILDVGVGAGRSARLLRLLSVDYVAIDYTAREMVELCRRNLPELDVRQADARDLSMFESDHFGLVVFSFNGIDAIDHVGRRQALAEMSRVLRPGGLLLFSTLNKDGHAFGEAPWQVKRVDWSGPRPGWFRAGRFVASLPANVGRYRRSYANWFRHRHRLEDHGGWAVGPLGAHDWSLLAHYTTLAEERRELDEVGLTIEAVWANSGRPVDLPELRSTATHHHIVAAKHEDRAPT